VCLIAEANLSRQSSGDKVPQAHDVVAHRYLESGISELQPEHGQIPFNNWLSPRQRNFPKKPAAFDVGSIFRLAFPRDLERLIRPLHLEGNAMTISGSEDVSPPFPTCNLRVRLPSKVAADAHNLCLGGKMFLALAIRPIMVF